MQVVGNTLTGTTQIGVEVFGGTTASVTIQGDSIDLAAGSLDGISAQTSGTLLIGGGSAGQGVTITGTALDGIYVPAGSSVTIQGDSIHAGIGVQLGGPGSVAASLTNDTIVAMPLGMRTVAVSSAAVVVIRCP